MSVSSSTASHAFKPTDLAELHEADQTLTSARVNGCVGGSRQQRGSSRDGLVVPRDGGASRAVLFVQMDSVDLGRAAGRFELRSDGNEIRMVRRNDRQRGIYVLGNVTILLCGIVVGIRTKGRLVGMTPFVSRATDDGHNVDSPGTRAASCVLSPAQLPDYRSRLFQTSVPTTTPDRQSGRAHRPFGGRERITERCSLHRRWWRSTHSCPAWRIHMCSHSERIALAIWF